MKVLGIRNFSGGIRYCILELNDSSIPICTNLSDENFISIPKEYEDNCEEMLSWYKNEIKRIIETNAIDSVALKRNENTPSCYSKLKQTMFMDCIVTLISKEEHIPFTSFLYTQIGVNSQNVKERAESLFGKTNKKWDKNMADAIMVAYKQIKNEI